RRRALGGRDGEHRAAHPARAEGAGAVSIAGEPSSAEANWWRRPVRFALTVLVFALLGPLIGGAITIVGYVVFGFHITMPGEGGGAIPAALTYGLWLAYPIGLVPAAGVGAIIAVRDRFGGSSLPEAALIG